MASSTVPMTRPEAHNGAVFDKKKAQNDRGASRGFLGKQARNDGGEEGGAREGGWPKRDQRVTRGCPEPSSFGTRLTDDEARGRAQSFWMAVVGFPGVALGGAPWARLPRQTGSKRQRGRGGGKGEGGMAQKGQTVTRGCPERPCFGIRITDDEARG